ncbi:MAG: elongation factor G, partial [Candidatus Omnitrophica bacterium]|nr:elongation factor G [Candidatus Omnitrophota bacterium]
IFFINKCDKAETDADKVTADIQEIISKKAVRLGSPDSAQLTELVAESDDALLEKYLETGELSAQEVSSGLTGAVAQCKILPILTGSAAADQGLPELLDAVVTCLPSPAQQKREACAAGDPEQKKEVVCSADGHFAAFVFKNISDPYVGQLTLLRVFSGSLASNTAFYNVSKQAKERIGQIYLLQGKEQRPVDKAVCGDIVAIAKLKEAGISDTLCNDKERVLFPVIAFPEPAISSSVRPKSREDEEKISGALHKLAAEDPTFKVSHDPQTKELIISGLGDLHLDIMVNRMRKRFNVSVELGVPKVSYKESITRVAKVQGKFKRQSGGRGQYGDCWIEIQPLERGGGFEFVDKIFGGAIPRNYIPSVEKGVRQACSEGAVAGYPIEDVRVILYDGSYHDVDSSDMAFQIAGAMALRKAVAAAGPILLEPIMDVEVVIPEEHLGAISGDVNSRRGRIMGMEIKGKSQVVKAQVPLAEMFKYANELRSMTGGRGNYTMRYSHYEPVPQRIAQTIIDKYQASKKHEEG